MKKYFSKNTSLMRIHLQGPKLTKKLYTPPSERRTRLKKRHFFSPCGIFLKEISLYLGIAHTPYTNAKQEWKSTYMYVEFVDVLATHN